MTRRRVQRWDVALVATLGLTGAGLLFATQELLVAAVVPLTYGLYGTLSSVTQSPTVTAHRTVNTSAPTPGEQVTVSVTVTNDSESVLPDVRVIDGVPPELAVDSGSPRACRSLPPGEIVTLEYSLVAKRGTYRFDDPAVRLRSLAGTEQVTKSLDADGTTELTCSNAVRDPPTRDATLPRAGTQPTDSGGSGLSFYATRQYQPGDPLSRIDWNHVAKTGEFVTIQYREEQAIRTVVVVDARPSGRVTPQPGYPTGVELSAYAGERVTDALEQLGVSLSITAVGLEDDAAGELVGPDGLPWVGPESRHSSNPEAIFSAIQDSAAAEEAEPVGSMSTTADIGDGTTGGEPAVTRSDGGAGRQRRHTGGRTVENVLKRMPPNAQVVYCTPLLDEWPVEFVSSLAVHGYQTTVISPDVTGRETVGQRIAGLDRRQRLKELQRTGAATVSWQVDEPIDRALRTSLPRILSR